MTTSTKTNTTTQSSSPTSSPGTAKRFGLRQRATRVRRISLTFGRIYLGIKTHQWIERTIRPPDMVQRWSRLHTSGAEAIYQTAIELRGLILKACQFIGSRADVAPPEYVERLAALQDRVPHRSFDVVQEIVEDELGDSIDGLFASFSREPIAAASLAQVHEARLHTGERVAVKVQYPEIAEIVHSDLANLRALLAAVGLVEKDLDLMPLLDELVDHVPLELDFRHEANNARRIAAFFDERADVSVPQIFDAYTTERVLVMEFIEGTRIGDKRALVRAGIDPNDVMSVLVDAYADQILRHGFFHADPHPGNLLVRRLEGGAPEIVFVDFGIAKELPHGFHAGVTDFATAAFKADASAMAEALLGVGFETRDACADSLLAISRVMLAGVREALDKGDFDPDRVRRHGEEIARLVREDPIVQMPGHVYLLGRVIALLAGLGKTLGVRTNLVRMMLPFVMGRG
ncbi:MAG: ABC1 kinase family protein [bacterium]|nr:ABC1 kinase family protein [bacterium]